MLDELIYDLADIDRAATIPGVGFVKLKLKKLGSIDLLLAALRRIRAHGLQPVLGDGTATDIACLLEARVAALEIGNAGEMNGFLKLRRSLLRPALPFAGGAIRLDQGYVPEIDRAALAACTVVRERHAVPRTALRGGEKPRTVNGDRATMHRDCNRCRLHCSRMRCRRPQPVPTSREAECGNYEATRAEKTETGSRNV